MSSTIRIRALAAIIAVTTGALLITAGPAQAGSMPKSDSGGGDVCWSTPETAILQCFDDESALADAVFEQTGTVLVEEGSDVASRSSAGLLATYVLARLYENASYGGSAYLVTSGSSATCTTGSGLSANLPGAWNDRVSSFRSYYSCSTRIWENSGQSGAWFGYSVNAPGVGALNDEASSYRVQ
jgi:hypothetical protein